MDWVTSYLSGRTQFVRFNGATSAVKSVLYGVPQGSVLGPALFVLYTADVIGLSLDPTQSSLLLTQMADCIARVEAWIASNRLRLNSSKTELIWLGSSRRLSQYTKDAMIVSGASIQPSTVVRDLGVIVDGDLSLAAHVSYVTRVCFFHLRQLRLIRRSLHTSWSGRSYTAEWTTVTRCSLASLPVS